MAILVGITETTRGQLRIVVRVTHAEFEGGTTFEILEVVLYQQGINSLKTNRSGLSPSSPGDQFPDSPFGSFCFRI